jgi:hypothetical protein
VLPDVNAVKRSIIALLLKFGISSMTTQEATSLAKADRGKSIFVPDANNWLIGYMISTISSGIINGTLSTGAMTCRNPSFSRKRVWI